jgi:hypothetical protein
MIFHDRNHRLRPELGGGPQTSPRGSETVALITVAARTSQLASRNSSCVPRHLIAPRTAAMKAG